MLLTLHYTLPSDVVLSIWFREKIHEIGFSCREGDGSFLESKSGLLRIIIVSFKN